jgi:hypothetical protein
MTASEVSFSPAPRSGKLMEIQFARSETFGSHDGRHGPLCRLAAAVLTDGDKPLLSPDKARAAAFPRLPVS